MKLADLPRVNKLQARRERIRHAISELKHSILQGHKATVQCATMGEISFESDDARAIFRGQIDALIGAEWDVINDLRELGLTFQVHELPSEVQGQAKTLQMGTHDIAENAEIKAA